jgi:hypothetical protein
MAINVQAVQLVVGAGAVDARYRRLLLRDRVRALTELGRRRDVPHASRLSEEDRRALHAIRARTFAEFARGVDQLHPGAGALPATQ